MNANERTMAALADGALLAGDGATILGPTFARWLDTAYAAALKPCTPMAWG